MFQRSLISPTRNPVSTRSEIWMCRMLQSENGHLGIGHRFIRIVLRTSKLPLSLFIKQLNTDFFFQKVQLKKLWKTRQFLGILSRMVRKSKRDTKWMENCI